jgi:GT2 family glycosyltransferase
LRPAEAAFYGRATSTTQNDIVSIVSDASLGPQRGIESVLLRPNPVKSDEPHRVRILAVIVVYKMSPLQTPSFITLQRAKEAVPSGDLDLKIHVFDNSCDGRDPGPIPPGVEYHPEPENAGLSHAYNQALRLATVNGYDWLLTFDQDSSVPFNFLLRITEIARAIENDPSIAAIVPLITESGKRHSPYWFFAGALPRHYEAGEVRVSNHDTYAFNSASTFRVSALREVGGYNPWFWLDYCDGYIFRQLHRNGRRVYIAGDIEVGHDFASTHLQKQVTLDRYRNMRLAECAFWDLEMGTLAGWERTYGLARHALRHLLFRNSPQHKGITYEFLKRRLFWSRKRRLEAWERETLERFPALSQTRLPPFF